MGIRVSGSAGLPLSIVIPSRNDEDWRTARLKAGVEGILDQARRFGLKAELILVEWNPPRDRPPLSSLLDWPRDGNPCRVRIVTVPPEVHRRFPHADKVPFFPMYAWNTGFRRATGEFILSMTADVLYSDALVRFLAAGGFDPDAFYRVDRSDVRSAVLELPLGERMDYCERNILRVSGRHRHFYDPKHGIPHLHVGGAAEFLLMGRKRWHDLRGWPHFICGEDVVFCYMAHLAGAREVVLEPPLRVFHLDHADTTGRLSLPFSNILLPAWMGFKERWPRPLRRALSLRMDRKYQSRSRWARIGVPYGTLADVEGMLVGMFTGTRPRVSNPEDWGLGGEDLPEAIVA